MCSNYPFVCELNEPFTACCPNSSPVDCHAFHSLTHSLTSTVTDCLTYQAADPVINTCSAAFLTSIRTSLIYLCSIPSIFPPLQIPHLLCHIAFALLVLTAHPPGRLSSSNVCPPCHQQPDCESHPSLSLPLLLTSPPCRHWMWRRCSWQPNTPQATQHRHSAALPAAPRF